MLATCGMADAKQGTGHRVSQNKAVLRGPALGKSPAVMQRTAIDEHAKGGTRRVENAHVGQSFIMSVAC